MAPVPPIWDICQWQKFPWKLKYMAKYILKAFFLTTFPSTQKKCSKIYAVTLVLPLKKYYPSKSNKESHIIMYYFSIYVFFK